MMSYQQYIAKKRFNDYCAKRDKDSESELFREAIGIKVKERILQTLAIIPKGRSLVPIQGVSNAV